MKKLIGHVNEIGDLEHLDGREGCVSGLVVLVDREQLKNNGGPFVFADVVLVPKEQFSNSWKRCADELPELGKMVWLFEAGHGAWIGDRSAIDGDGTWLWTHCDGQPYITKAGVWDGDCLADDDYQPTHWMELPELPDAQAGMPAPRTEGGME